MDQFIGVTGCLKTLRCESLVGRNATIEGTSRIADLLDPAPRAQGKEKSAGKTPKYLMQREQTFAARERGSSNRERDFDRDPPRC